MPDLTATTIVESDINVAPESTGPAVKNLRLDVLQDDGTVSSKYVQVVAIADYFGRIIYPDATNREILEELRGLREDIAMLADSLE